MPYRNSHWWILGLFPLIAVAYWPGYLGRLDTAPFAYHAHGITAAAWLALLAAQSWSIHARNPALHRAAGMATFLVLPLFAAAGPLALHGVAVLWRAGRSPFHAAYGPQLVIADVVAGPAVIAMVAYAFLRRRRVQAHAAAMLATALLVLPPILGRLFAVIPGFPRGGAAGFGGFRLSFQLAMAVTLLLTLWLAWRRPGGRVGFGFAAAATLAQMIGFETLGRTALWQRMTVLLADLPAVPLSLAGGIGTAAILFAAWRSVPPRPAAHTLRPARAWS